MCVDVGHALVSAPRACLMPEKAMRALDPLVLALQML